MVAEDESTANARLPSGVSPLVPAVEAAAPAPPLPPLIRGKYQAIRLIAKGGMGAVYEVVHVNTGEHLALKVMLARSLLSPELVERFRREARVHTALKSEHVVRILDADVAPELDDAPFLVMELLKGQDLERRCRQRAPSDAEVMDWMRQMSPVLDKAHALGIIHRDLKPENLFLVDREDLPPLIKILDFGIAKMAAEGVGPATATGQILGTPRYMAPEQATGAKEISPSVDRFALGLIVFRLLAGRSYFEGDNWFALLRDVGRGPMARPSELGCDRGAGFDTWFAKACALDPRSRFATSVDQAEALSRALKETPSRGHARLGSRRWVAVVVAGGLGVLGGAVVRRWATPAPAVTAVVRPSIPAPPVMAPSTPRPAPAPSPTPEMRSSARVEPRHASAAPEPRASRRIVHIAKSQPKPPRRDAVWDEP